MILRKEKLTKTIYFRNMGNIRKAKLEQKEMSEKIMKTIIIMMKAINE